MLNKKKRKALAGFEPASQDSESCVLTNYTIKPRRCPYQGLNLGFPACKAGVITTRPYGLTDEGFIKDYITLKSFFKRKSA